MNYTFYLYYNSVAVKKISLYAMRTHTYPKNSFQMLFGNTLSLIIIIISRW